MLKRYKKFLDEFDRELAELTQSQKSYLKCKKGCAECCQNGDYPFSRLEMEYLMSGFLTLPENIKQQIRLNISGIKDKNNYTCPFLINNLCSLYNYRGIVCRTHGLAWYDESEDKIRLPYCVNIGLNYSKVFDRDTGEVFLENPIRERLRIDTVLQSDEAKKYDLECGEIRPLIKWF